MLSAVTTAESVDLAVGSAESDPTSTFSLSVVVSGIRCLLAYVVFPWLLPLFGVAKGTGPAIGLAVGVVAIGFNLASIRRFWVSRHRWRWAITALNGTIIVLLTVLLVLDLNAVLT